MDPIITPMLIGMGVSAVASLIGELMAGGKEAEARKVMAEAAKMYDAVELPKLEQAVAQELGPSAFESIAVDPAYKSAQLDALNRLSQIAEEGGMTLADKAAMNQITGQLARRDAAARGAIREDMQARGTLGAGAELASRLAAQQESSQIASERGLGVAAQAQQRALDAIMNRGAMAGDIRRQEYGEQSDLARSRDLINQYNAAARERAQGYNLGLSQREFENQMRRTGAQANARLGQGTQMMGEAQGIRQAAAGYGTAGGKVAQAAAMSGMEGGPSGSGASGAGYALDEYGNAAGKNRVGSYTTAGGKRY